LASKANKEKKSTLATVFLLNNYYYIQKALKESELHTLLAGKSLELLKEYDKNMSEQRDIYKGR
jgi:hypothetical protein